MSKHWRPDETLVHLRSSWQDSGWGFAVALLIGAAALGVGAGAVLSFNESPRTGGSDGWVPPAPQTLIPDVAADAADAEWEGRGAGQVNPSTGSGRTGQGGGVRASFSFCHTGGGTNCVVDGDTFYIGGAKVRIGGIDAPETHPPRCAHEARLGRQATEQLQALLNSGAVTMTGIGRDRDSYGRLLRNVAVDGQDVGEVMISAGVAREYGSGRRGWC